MKMKNCQHQWKMTNIQFGFVFFEKCYHCNDLRTYFSMEGSALIGEEYREEDHFWNIVEKAQSFIFDLKCTRCNNLEKFTNLMGLLYCTGCLSDCEVEKMQKKFYAEKTWIIVAFGHLPQAIIEPIPSYKMDILSSYFNQRRDTSRSRIKMVPFNLIKDFTQCKGDFIHDVGMLSTEPPKERKHIF